MRQIKVIFSPNFSSEEFFEPISGITFKQSRNIEVHSIELDDDQLVGIQNALRKNILLPYDKETRQFANEVRLEQRVETIVNETVVDEPVSEPLAEKEEVKKTVRKKSNKKDNE